MSLVDAGTASSPPLPDAQGPPRLRAALSVQRIGAVYVWLGIIVFFSITTPDTFPTMATVKQVLNANAITGMVALSLVIPLAAGVFDLSVAATMTITGVFVAKLIVVSGLAIGPAIAAAMALAVLIGVVNATIVVVLNVDSFIATLASSSVLAAFTSMISDEAPVTGSRLSGSFARVGQHVIGGVQPGVWYLLVLAAAIWYILSRTGLGRNLYAAGFNPDATRLAGVAVNRLRFGSLVASAVISGFVGIVLASNLAAGSPTSGASYLLPAFAAAFLGSTQLRPGRFNAWGTLIALLLLGTGTTGLALSNTPDWAPSMFTGVVLIASLAIGGVQRQKIRSEKRGIFGFLAGRRGGSD
jgi:ribose transport system permease protein